MKANTHVWWPHGVLKTHAKNEEVYDWLCDCPSAMWPFLDLQLLQLLLWTPERSYPQNKSDNCSSLFHPAHLMKYHPYWENTIGGISKRPDILLTETELYQTAIVPQELTSCWYSNSEGSLVFAHAPAHHNITDPSEDWNNHRQQSLRMVLQVNFATMMFPSTCSLS